MTRRTPAQYDWSRLEFDETLLTKHFTSPRSLKIAFVVVHHMTIVGTGTGSALTACYNTWQTREASAHYGVDGKYVRQFVWDRDAAWATANRTGNHAGISIEHANSTRDPKWLVSDTTWKTGARLAAQLHKVYKLGRPVKDKTLRKHSSFFATACPGPYLGGTIWSAYVAEAQRVYDEITGATPAVPVEPPPPVDETTLTVMLLPTAGYNADNAPGVTRWKSNTDGLAALVNKHKPDLVGTTELSNRQIDPMLPRFAAALPRYAHEPGGTDGRHWFRLKETTNHVASGHVVASNASELNDDDKQAAWTIVDFDDVRVQAIVAHTENEDGVDRSSGINADDLRVTQARSLLTRAIADGAEYEPDHIIYVGDFNSEGMVKDAMLERGWKAIGPGYFTRWDDTAKKTFDWGFIRTGSTTFERINHAYSDHTALLIRWTIKK